VFSHGNYIHCNRQQLAGKDEEISCPFRPAQKTRWYRQLPSAATPSLVTHPDTFSIQIAALGYRTGQKAVGISSLFSCRTGRTPVCGGHAPPGLRDSSRTLARSLRSWYTQVWTNLLSPPSSLVQQAARG
jgi:hypothetical protein